jgi:hypothetical protein
MRYQFKILSEVEDFCSKETQVDAKEFETGWVPTKFIHHDKLFEMEGQFVVNGKFTIALEVIYTVQES